MKKAIQAVLLTAFAAVAARAAAQSLKVGEPKS